MPRIALLIVAFILTACVPWPHMSNLAPAVAGTVAPDMEVRLVAQTASERRCEGRVKDFRTNAQGDFYSPPIRRFSGYWR
jgi:hypothetical protein